ncbi:hypothetical protein QYE76_013543 [Lolium multiflorum]|uniref:Disease resistance protein At4g27190-like leucine-rich repeats domain-containing protein n=1 Tax=Lolium multiflorum TaxID=4521 RepID=A0AAD8TZ20_LOLMU|nr:hypothetical protein QYE76_013543 [Lolium multiflorum]
MSVPLEEAVSFGDVQNTGNRIYEIIMEMGCGKVFYIDGWDGFGASAVLRYMASALPAWRLHPELSFDRTIFIDCSKWKNRRAVQRAVARELKLDRSVMDILDKKDECDDFSGVDESSRGEIDSVARVINQTLRATKFMMIFLNGSYNEIDVGTIGIPLTRFGGSMVLWTFDRSCLTMHHHNHRKITAELRYTHVFMHSSGKISKLESSDFRELLHQQAAAIVARGLGMQDIDPTMVAECCLYGLFLHYNFHSATKLDWLSHASNYWICDGIIKGHRARDISNTLRGEISWVCDASLIDEVLKSFMKYLEPRFLVVKDADLYKEGPYRWISVTSRNMEISGLRAIPATTSSFFLAFERSSHPSTLPNGLFGNSSKLAVLVLCSCAFDFASPPFHKCDNLRFLELDHCTDCKISEEENHDHTEWACLNNLLVLDLRYTDWGEILSEEKMSLMTQITELNIEGVRCWQYIAQLQGRLPNLQRLRIIRPTCSCETSNDVDDSFIDKTSMEILDLSGNFGMEILPTSLSRASSLQTLILDGCNGLENIGQLSPSLRSFSFDGYARPSAAKDMVIRTSKISLEGCTKLDNVFVRGLNNLVDLDLSGTAIKILNFKTMVVQVPRLKRLFLIGCKHLRAIIFVGDNGYKLIPNLELVCIDTRSGIVCPRPSIDKTKSFQLRVHAVVVDARLTWSLRRLFSNYFTCDKITDIYFNIHVTSSPPVHDWVIQSEATNNDKFDISEQGCLQQLIAAGKYSDVLSMVGDPPMKAFPQPPATRFDRHIEIGAGSFHEESGLEALGPTMIYFAQSLHLHDVSIHPTNATAYTWDQLTWCRTERCPKLDIVFPPRFCEFPKLETFWASDLLMARSIWSPGSLWQWHSRENSLKSLRHLHLHSCPRVHFVLPVWVSPFPSLETLHIIQCGDLGHVFILNQTYPDKTTTGGIVFPKLKTVHLHDLPKLRQICEVKMVAPVLENIKIRGCWALRRLPSVAACGQGAKKPTIEIEKDVWDNLEWAAGNRPDHFDAPVHSRYHKKKLPRVSFLRCMLLLWILELQE